MICSSRDQIQEDEAGAGGIYSTHLKKEKAQNMYQYIRNSAGWSEILLSICGRCSFRISVKIPTFLRNFYSISRSLQKKVRLVSRFIPDISKLIINRYSHCSELQNLYTKSVVN